MRVLLQLAVPKLGVQCGNSMSPFDISVLSVSRSGYYVLQESNGVQVLLLALCSICLLYTSPSPRDRG
eukprot:1589664-Amphidinium_carterae.1